MHLKEVSLTSKCTLFMFIVNIYVGLRYCGEKARNVMPSTSNSSHYGHVGIAMQTSTEQQTVLDTIRFFQRHFPK